MIIFIRFPVFIRLTTWFNLYLRVNISWIPIMDNKTSKRATKMLKNGQYLSKTILKAAPPLYPGFSSTKDDCDCFKWTQTSQRVLSPIPWMLERGSLWRYETSSKIISNQCHGPLSSKCETRRTLLQKHFPRSACRRLPVSIPYREPHKSSVQASTMDNSFPNPRLWAASKLIPNQHHGQLLIFQPQRVTAASKMIPRRHYGQHTLFNKEAYYYSDDIGSHP